MRANTAARHGSSEPAIGDGGPGAVSRTARAIGLSRTDPRPSFRKLVVVLHRYLTLSFGLVIVALSVSGSVLAFRYELLAAGRGAAAANGGAVGERSLQSLAEEARRSRPGAQLSRIVFPDAGGSLIEFVLRAEDGAPQNVYADRSGLLQNSGRGRALQWLRELHESLFLGAALGNRQAHWAVGLAGLATLLASLSGLYLWWPRDGQARDAALRVNWRASWKRTNWDLHRVAGVLSAAFIVLVSASGTFVAFAYLDVEPEAAPPPGVSSGSLLSIDQLMEHVAAAAPGVGVRELTWTASDGGPVLVRLEAAAQLEAAAGARRFWLDARSGEVLRFVPDRRSTTLVMLEEAMRSIHRGHVLGLPGRIVVFLTGFAPLFLGMSGLVIWWLKRASRRVAAKRAAPTLPRSA